MSLYQTIFLIIFLPILLIFFVSDVIRGIRILFYNDNSYHFAYKMRLYLLGTFVGSSAREKYLAKLETDERHIRYRGIISLFGGIVGIIICLIWTYFLIISIFN
jgi:hypothetical protein